NDDYASVIPPAAGFANMAAVLVWVNANWAAYGTWSLVDVGGGLENLQLVSTTVTSGYLELGLVAASYCLEVPTPATTANAIVIDGVTIEFPEVVVDQANPALLVNAIAPFFTGELSIETVGGD